MCIRDRYFNVFRKDLADALQSKLPLPKMLFAAILKSLNRQLIIDKNVPALLAFLGGPLYFFTPLVSFNKEIVALIHMMPVSYTHLRAHETPEHLVCRLLLEKKKNPITSHNIYSH
eukprot:TRINITY_DN15307_c0_g1_i4.p1 TRINITY_DN15307_c0_g1~~TRINITY_DN15307_c0_g1_i4.p1  ORF type:complete len:116 (-),score=19.31 TRINITY_DN15307_c0_g1_i4:22-369(-)